MEKALEFVSVNEFFNRLESGVDGVRKIMKPLIEQTPVTVFAYVRVYDDGRMGWVSSVPDHDRYAQEQGFYRDNPDIGMKKDIPPGVRLWGQTQEFDGCEDFYRFQRDTFQMDHGMLLGRHQKDYVEWACFSGNSHKQRLFELFHKEMGCFELFMDHFIEQLTPSMEKLLIDGMAIEDIRPNIHQPPEVGFTSEQRHAFLHQLGWDDYLLVTAREREALAYFRLGLRCPEIGERMHLSRRTVEHYLESVRDKLLLDSRTELLVAAERFHKAGLLPAVNVR